MAAWVQLQQLCQQFTLELPNANAELSPQIPRHGIEQANDIGRLKMPLGLELVILADPERRPCNRAFVPRLVWIASCVAAPPSRVLAHDIVGDLLPGLFRLGWPF